MNIGPPPEFGEDGSPPQLTSGPVEIARWDLGISVTKFFEPEIKALGRQAMPEAMARERQRQGRTLIGKKLGNFFDSTIFIPATRVLTGKQSTEALDEALGTIAITRWLDERNAYNLSWKVVQNWQMYCVFDQFWRRNDLVTQLAPGTSDKVGVSLKVGISNEQANEISRSLNITSPACGCR
jgi:hypothetical protein